MTLSPVFRSAEAVETLRAAGVWDRLRPAALSQAVAITAVKADLPRVLDTKFIDQSRLGEEQVDGDMRFFQEFFFLILFRSILDTIKFPAAALDLCSELNFCIKGTITAADNLFDDQSKSLLPLTTGKGDRFASILQLMTFERLTGLALQRGVATGAISPAAVETFQKTRMSRMAKIGSLEGSEEGGVTAILEPAVMITDVHRVRGGALFELGFIAPMVIGGGVEPALLARAQAAISRLGTAFQIVDDLTDFEIDIERGTHNILVAQITHHGTPEERARLAELRKTRDFSGDVVADDFAHSGRLVVEIGEREAKESLLELQRIGFWFPPSLSEPLVKAIVGLEGIERMKAL
jgi:hypothetical protein